MIFGYIQTFRMDELGPGAQRLALEAEGVDEIHEDNWFLHAWKRPRLKKLIGFLRPEDVVVVYSLDRFSRSFKDLLGVLARIAETGAAVRSLTEDVDTSGPGGKSFMELVRTFQGVENSMLRESTLAGLEAARAEGRVGGRKPKFNAAQRNWICEQVLTGQATRAEMARTYGVHPSTIGRLVAGDSLRPVKAKQSG